MKKKVVFEDAVNAYNKWVSGQASREFGAIRTKYNDLFGDKKNKEDQDLNNLKTKTNNVLPFPLPNTVSIIGDLLTNTTEAINNYETALKQPLIKEDKKAVKELETIVHCLNKSLAELKGIFDVLEANAKGEDA